MRAAALDSRNSGPHMAVMAAEVSLYSGLTSLPLSPETAYHQECLQNSWCFLQLGLCPPAQIPNVEGLTPGTSDCGVIWRPGVYRGHRVNTRALRWALIKYDR